MLISFEATNRFTALPPRGATDKSRLTASPLYAMSQSAACISFIYIKSGANAAALKKKTLSKHQILPSLFHQAQATFEENKSDL